MLRIGVTGGIGSGKSFVCSAFARLGVPVLSADLLAKELMHNDPALRRKVLALLGSSAYDSDGSLNRQSVAAKIFSNETLRARINAAVHPRVVHQLDRQLGKLEREGRSMAIVEAALIYEAGYDKRLDVVVVVDANERVRIQRLMDRDKMTADEVRRRIRSQWSTAQKAEKADYVIRNNGSLEELETNVRFLHSLFTLISGKR
ncbi:MAG: dephospho-CoA kinase [Ignavibacteria bacterium]|nr:dephospho-CoA kinase [Ignavibacteria bacterium]